MHGHHRHGHKHAAHVTKALDDIQADAIRLKRTYTALKSALALTSVFMVVEAVCGYFANSLALLGDAVHMLGDAGGLALALLSVWISTHPVAGRRFRHADRWGALLNALWVLGLAGVLIYEAVMRLGTLGGIPRSGLLESGLVVNGELALAVAVLGLFVNILSLLFLKSGPSSDVNIRAAVLHVMVDLMGSFGAIVSGAVISLTGWMPIDPIVMLVIGGMIALSATGVIVDIFRGS